MAVKGNSIDKIIVVGERVLIKPKSLSNKTKTGLFLPPGYSEKEEIQSGYVIKVGPGYPIPWAADDSAEPWKKSELPENVKYIPLQPLVGDLAIYLAKGAIEILIDSEKYLVVPQSSILLLERDDSLFE
ncbi:MAG: co-chaperone GroES [Bacteroidales bacterium]|nr:co-chaperone GroES [Bacteroidales bacterium]